MNSLIAVLQATALVSTYPLLVIVMVMLFVLGWWGWSVLLIWCWSLQTRLSVSPMFNSFVQWICWNEHKTTRLYGSWCREIKRNHMRCRNSWNATSMLWHICGLRLVWNAASSASAALSISVQLCYHFGSAWLLPNCWCRAPAAISCLSETLCQDKCEQARNFLVSLQPC